MDKRAKLERILQCPACGCERLDYAAARCTHCAFRFSIEGRRFVFTREWHERGLARRDWLNRIKETIKVRCGPVYPALIELVSPVADFVRPRRLIAGYGPQHVVVDIGAGTSRIRGDVITLDLAPYDSVDVVASIEHLPIRDESVDAVVNVAVLEHLSRRRSTVREFWRILRPGGRLICFVPFMQGIHAAPDDYVRYTPAGLRELLSEFEEERLVALGPTSGLLWLLQEWIAMVLSLGIRPLYRVLVPLTWVLSPLKYLDLLLQYHPAAENISSGYYAVMVKPRRSGTP